MAVAESSSLSPLDAECMLGMTQQVTNMLPILKMLTFPLLDALQHTHLGLQTSVTPSLHETITIWLRIYYNLLDWHPISQPVCQAPLTSPTIGVFAILDNQHHHIRALLTGPRPVRIF